MFIKSSFSLKLLRDQSNKEAVHTTRKPTEEGCSFGVIRQQMSHQNYLTNSDSHGHEDSDANPVKPHLSSSLLLQQQTYLSHMGQQSMVNITGGMISTNSTNTVITSIHQYPYDYNSSNSNVDGSGGYQHGTTGTNNSALSQSAGHQGLGLTAASSSGIGQYQHYPYHSKSTDLAMAKSSVNVIDQQHPTSVASSAMSTSTPTNGNAVSQQATNGVKKDLNSEVGRNDLPSSSVSHPPTTVAAPVQQQQENLPYYSEAQYGYNSSNSNMDGSGGYQHGTTCTNNSALSQSAGHQQDQGLTAASSGMGQYQQYPYNPVNSISPSDKILQSVLTRDPTIAHLPVDVVPTNTVAGNTTITTSYSNLEVLTILDTSGPAPTTSDLPEAQLSEALLLSVNKRETTTLTKSTTKVIANTSDIIKSDTNASSEAYVMPSNDLFPGEVVSLEESPMKKAKLG